MSALTKYQEAYENAPARGGGLHQHIMKLSRLGVMAGIPNQQIIDECNQRLDGVKNNEVAQAVAKASSTTVVTSDPIKRRSAFKPPTEDPLDTFIRGQSTDFRDLMRFSPVRLDGADEAGILLETLYDPNDHLFIGDVYTKEVRTADEWLGEDLSTFPHIIPNPMTGSVGQTSEGKDSMRCEATVADLRYAVCEMDEVSLPRQVGFWMRCIEMKLPVAAIIHSGGKSLHGWFYVNCGQDSEKWERNVKGWLFKEFGARFGFDPACSNKARLSRLVGHNRGEKGLQKLLYLDGSLR